MQIQFFCPRWGCEHISWNQFFTNAKCEGYDGVEIGIPFDLPQSERSQMLEGLQTHNLLMIGQHWQTAEGNFASHFATFEKHLYSLASAGPIFINSQTGKDYFTEEQNIALINRATEISNETGVAIIHETHRGKWSFAAHITRQYLKKFPAIRLTLDASHWCNVAESFLDDQQEAMALAIQHTDHIHARVGFPEGPQVMDPRAPEWQEALEKHLVWWDAVIQLKRTAGQETFTVTPEFGAPPYLPLLPYTKQPIVNQWEVNAYMMNLLRRRYEAK